MSLTATARSIPGTLRQTVVIDGQHRLITDEPERVGGEGSAPAPHELFPAALAACVSTTLVMYARILSRTPIGLPSAIRTRSGVIMRVEPAVARILQDAAASVTVEPSAR